MSYNLNLHRIKRLRRAEVRQGTSVVWIQLFAVTEHGDEFDITIFARDLQHAEEMLAQLRGEEPVQDLMPEPAKDHGFNEFDRT